MIKQEENKMLDRIEKLIVDGNKEVIERVDKKLEAVKQELQLEIKGVKQELQQEMKGITLDVKDLKFQYNTMDTSIRALHYDVRELDKKVEELDRNVKELDRKVDAHLKVPHGV